MKNNVKTAKLPPITRRAKSGIVQMNFPPFIAIQYVEQWNEQLRKDENVPQEVRDVAADILTMVKIASNVMTPKQVNDIIPKRTDSANAK